MIAVSLQKNKQITWEDYSRPMLDKIASMLKHQEQSKRRSAKGTEKDV